MKKLMIAMAAVAMVGAANAEASYSYSASVYFSKYAAKDSNPGEEHEGWYSVYCLTQESAQEAMETENKVTYVAYATWLGKNFSANKQATIDEAQAISFEEFYGDPYPDQYYFRFSSGAAEQPTLSDALCVAFFDNGNGDLAYKVMESFTPTWWSEGTAYGFCSDDLDSAGNATAWFAVAPEPTSGLLMLLGMAGLALKRKQRG